MKVLNFGSCNIDFVYSLDHIVAPGETESSAQMQIFPGGKGLNQSIALAKAGVAVYHAGCIGEDGKLLLDTLQVSGVDTRYLRQVDAKNGHAMIQVSKEGENSIVLFAGSNVMITEEQIDAVLADFAEGDILLLQNEINSVDLLIEKAYEKGMVTILNPSPFNGQIGRMNLSHISCLILNEVEAKGFSGSEDVQESLTYLRKRYPNLNVMLTLGKKGCVYASGEETVCQDAFPVHAVDTTAAGDTFTGYFIAGIVEGLPYSEILKRACAASAIAVTRNGAAPSIPSVPEVMAFLQEKEAL